MRKKSAYFFKEKQNLKKKTDENQILFKFALNSQDSLHELNLQLIFDLMSISNLKKIETAKFKCNHFN